MGGSIFWRRSARCVIRLVLLVASPRRDPACRPRFDASLAGRAQGAILQQRAIKSISLAHERCVLCI